MVQSTATTVEAYLDELDEDRRPTIEAVLRVVRDNLPDGYEEDMRWGMVAWEVPLERYPETYNGQPLLYAALAAQKRHCSLYLMGVYTDVDDASAFHARYEATGKKLDMGKSCVRFKRVDDLPLELIGETIADVSVDEYIARYESARSRKGGRSGREARARSSSRRSAKKAATKKAAKKKSATKKQAATKKASTKKSVATKKASKKTAAKPTSANKRGG